MNNQSLKETILKKISKEEVKMLPKIYFIVGNIFLLLSITLATTTATLFFSLLFFRLEMNRPLDLIHTGWLTKIPWEYGLIAIIFFLVSLILIRKSEISYKINPLIVGGLLLLVAIGGGLLLKEVRPTRNFIRRIPYHRERPPNAHPKKNLPRYAPPKSQKMK